MISRLLARLKGSMPFRVITEYGNSQAGNYSSILAFNAFMSMFPMILGVLAILGLVLNDHSIEQHVQSSIVSAFPSSAQTDISSAVSHLHDTAGIFGILSILGLLWTGTNFFGSLEFALAQIFRITQRDFLRQRAMGVVMIMVLTVCLVISVGANTLMNLVSFMAGLGPLLGLVDMVVLMLIIYRCVPNRTFHLARVWPGALLAGLLTEAITLLFPLYGKLVHGFNAYGQGFALFFLLATWLAFISQFMLIGAVFNKVRLGDRFEATGLVAAPSRELERPANRSAAGTATPVTVARHDPVASGTSGPGGATIRPQ
ncbi:MAG: YihY/virulence factor BrkB family protein [Candidatus Dormiibacterota bacterium]